MKKTKRELTTTSQIYTPKIKVVGVGGGGGNAVSRMVQSINIRGLEFIAINTDAQDLDYCEARKKIYIGRNLTRGLGTGMNPEIGRQAAEENKSEIVEALKGADLVFITAGLGGGTGSGVSPLVAEAAREAGALTVGVVTKPFGFEGSQRMKIAESALMRLKEKVDTLIVVPNDRIFSIIRKDTPLLKAFEYIDDVLRSAVQGISELIAMPGIINVDFADVRAIMQDAGSALVGIGIGSGPDRAVNAVSQVVNSPLLEVSIEGARGVLFGIAGSKDLRMTEINDVAKTIAASVDASARIIFGAYHDRKLKPGQIKITLIATGFNANFSRSMDIAPSPTLFTVDEPPKAFHREEPKVEEPSIKEAAKKAEEDIWDIPAFLRKRKK
ncbi:MAG: cell division protein FtsZ [Patescibacteria group bacterium]